MSTPEPGWYDDPWSPAQYRYWDGATWTPHVAQRQAPVAPPTPTSIQAPTQTYAGAGGPAPYSGYASSAPVVDSWRPTFGPTTPDGVPLASRWARLGGRLLDNLFVTILAFPLNFYFIRKYNAAAQDWLDEVDRRQANGASPNPLAFPDEMVKWLVPIAIITVVVGVIYEAWFLNRSGATPGKHIVGTAVRKYDDPSIPPAEGVVVRRVAAQYSYQLLYIVPVLWPLLALIIVVDNGWLLWDRKRQTLHDKVAGTTVVKNR
jgi:uncharacterized RDD family membrane protein YckC